MKRICLETMITHLYQSRMRSTDKIRIVCGSIFAALGLNIDNYNKAAFESFENQAHDDLIYFKIHPS